ncbi:MAG TPA: type IV secretion system DNA-binding domain-containing protein [Patescibacteria group bacterium]|nr:type IV secretion system DNA-binding domain-containing protein [Patescibacteria group bacterium]
MVDNNEEQKSVETFKTDPNVNFFGLTNFRNQYRKFGIKLDDRRRHVYIVGKTGMGKTTMLENMVLNDIYAGHGVGYIDPHGDTAEKIIDFIPSWRMNDVVYFNPADLDYPIGFNILETINASQKHLVASGLMGVFKKIWPDVWSSRMEYILNNTILALLDFPGTTLLGINRMLADEDYRRRVVRNSKDPVVKSFWQTEFASYSEKYQQEAVAPIQNKIGQFLSASVIRNIVAQVKSRINIREIMDNKKIFIMNLSKGRIGEDNSRLLGGMLITKLQLSAMERVDIPEPDRKDFFLYVDEFQNFATESFANILSEARKYRLGLTLAHQYMEQLDETVLAAVIGNVGTMVTFRVGSSDAEILAKEFAPVFVEENLVNLPKFNVYLKLMIDGVASRPFSALAMPPIKLTSAGSSDKVIKVSRERYSVQRDKIEDKIARWSGMVVLDENGNPTTDEDDEGEDELKDLKPEVKPVKPIEVAPKAPVKSQPVVKPNEIKKEEIPKTTPPVEATKEENGVTIAQEIFNVLLAEDGPRTVTPVKPASLLPPSGPQPSMGSPRPITSSNNPPADPFKKKKRRKKKRGSGTSQGFTGSEPVLLVNPGEKGLSLNQLKPQAKTEDRSQRDNNSRFEPVKLEPRPAPPAPKTEESLGFIQSKPIAPTTESPSQNGPKISGPRTLPKGKIEEIDKGRQP